MKWWLTLLLALMSPVWASNPAVGGHVISSNQGGAGSYTSSAITTNPSGSDYAVLLSSSGDSAQSVSDSQGATYGALAFSGGVGTGSNCIEEAASDTDLCIYTCTANCNNGSTSRTFSVTAAGGLYIIECMEVTNTTGIDVVAAGYGTTGTTNVSVTPTVANDLIVANGYSGSGTAFTISPSTSGWTALEHTAAARSMGSGYLAGASISAQNAAMTGVTSGDGLAVITMAFKPASGPVGLNSGFLMVKIGRLAVFHADKSQVRTQ